MSLRDLSYVCLLSVVAAFPAASEPEPVADSRAAIAAKFPEIAAEKIVQSPVDGLFEVRLGSKIAYVSADGRYLVQGEIIDLSTDQNLTEGRREGLRRDELSALGEKDMIVFSPAKPTATITVFTDIDCGYCRKLHAQIAEYNQQGIAIHYMAFPRAGVGSASYEKAVSVWCASDPRDAMTQAKLGAEPDPAQCENPIAEQYQLGLDLGVSGTPSLLTADGQMIPGYVPPDQLRERLDRMAEAAPR